MSGNPLNKMDRLVWSWGLMLSVWSMAVVAYRNDLSSTRHAQGCIWSTIESTGKETSTSLSSNLGGVSSASSRSSGTNVINPPPNLPPGLLSSLSPLPSPGGGVSLNCNLRTLSMDFSFSREQVEQTRVVKITCSSTLFFESFLTKNQTTLPNLMQMDIQHCKIRKIPKRVFNSLTKLKSLVIQTQNVQWPGSGGLEVEEGSFEGLEQLETLDLSQNNIWSLNNNNILCPMKNLLRLNLSRNRLSDIEELSTAGCALSVQNLDLSFNTLRRLGDNAFSQLSRLGEVRLQNNFISELDDSAFGALTQVKLLNLSSNRLVALAPFIFKTNPSLRYLYLQNNSISALSPQVFSKLDQLQLLDLSRNTLTSQWMKEDMFKDLVRLVILKLSWNQLNYIDSGIFRDLISLQALHLDNNVIEKIHPDAFQTLANLHILDLSNNRLTTVDSKIFSNLFVLRQLYIDHNKLTYMDKDSLKNCTSLQDFGLSNNYFTEVPKALQTASLGFLKTFDIGENKIVRVDNASFAGMTQLYGLRLVDNKIQSIDNGFCQSLKMLRVLNLSQNRINKISSAAFSSCPELRVLRLDKNEIEDLRGALANQLPSLLWFNVSENRLTSADYNQLPPAVEWLDLSYNSIVSLGSPQLKNKNNLRVLDVSYNKLKHIDHTSISTTLETLRINHNNLTSIAADTFISSIRLRRAELIGNNLQSLPLTSMRLPEIPSGQKIPEFYLGKNPFKCSAENEWLTRANQLTVLRTYPRILDIEEITCTPALSRKAVISVVSASQQEFISPYKSECARNCNCCGFACDCESVCPSRCNCFHDASWNVNIIQCSNANYSALPERLPMDASEIRLDGNNISQLKSHIFIGKKNLRTLYLNDSKLEFVSNKTFNGLRSLETLHLEDNLLTSLNGYEFTDVESLRELYLQNNLIRTIAKETIMSLKFLQVLRLDGNLLIDFHFDLSENGFLNSIMLSSNPWSCECDVIESLAHFASKTAIVADYNLIRCQRSSWSESDSEVQQQVDTVPISSMCKTASYSEEIVDNEIPPSSTYEIPPPPGKFSPPEADYNNNTFWALVICLSAVFIVLFVLLIVFRHDIYSWSKQVLCRGSVACCPGESRSKRSEEDQLEKLFDTYLLYSKKDEDFVVNKIAPELELGSPARNLRVCLHYRDLCLNPENANIDMILSAMDASKRVVIVLSRDFIQSEWNFRQAIQSAISLHEKKLIFVFLPPFTEQNLSMIWPEIKNSNGGVNKSSSLQWTDRDFWPKFRKLLPSPSSHSNSTMSSTLLNFANCEPHHLPYNLIMNPNLLNQSNTLQHYPHHYHQNILPYQIPSMMTRNNSLPPVPKHQIVLPGPQQWQVQQDSNGLLNPQNNSLHQHHHQNNSKIHEQQGRNHNPIIVPNNHSLIHPIPSQLAPQHFGYSNEAFHLQQGSNHHHHLVPNHHQPHSNQPFHFGQNLHTHSHSSSQLSNSNFSSVCCYPHDHQHLHPQSSNTEQNYSSSAVSSANEGELYHVYSTLDSPPQSPNSHSSEMNQKQHHQAQHSTSSGISSGSDNMAGDSGSSAVSPSSPIKNGILNKLNGHCPNNNPTTATGNLNQSNGSNNGKMYFV